LSALLTAEFDIEVKILDIIILQHYKVGTGREIAAAKYEA
jgi:hypothetical protein